MPSIAAKSHPCGGLKFKIIGGWHIFFRAFIKQALRLPSIAVKSHPCGGLKFNAADKVRAEGACRLCRAEAVKRRECGLKFKIEL